MDSPNSHPLPEYPSSDDEHINFRGDTSDKDSDNTDSEYEDEMEGLWRGFDEGKAVLDEELEEEMQGKYEEDPEEEAADDRIKEMWEESDEEESDETKGHETGESSESEDEDEE